jgi:uncharacterized OsmC-like protein
MSTLVYKVTLRRVGEEMLEATGGTDGRVLLAPKGTPNSFQPVELLLVALGACSGMDLEVLAARDGVRIEELEVRVTGTKPLHRSSLDSVSVDYHLADGGSDQVASWLTEVGDICTVAVSVRDGGATVSHTGKDPTSGDPGSQGRRREGAS